MTRTGDEIRVIRRTPLISDDQSSSSAECLSDGTANKQRSNDLLSTSRFGNRSFRGKWFKVYVLFVVLVNSNTNIGWNKLTLGDPISGCQLLQSFNDAI
jgi:hypothetical protein